MTDSAHDADRALYERWRKNRPAEAVTPDALALARYAEFGLDEDEADAVELALATDLALFDDVIAARRRSDPDAVPEAVMARALALVGEHQGASIVAFPGRRRSWPARYRSAMTWGALAACLVAVSVMGFGLGVDAQQAIDDTASAVPVDLLDGSDSSSG